ncbi:phosphotransferase family protein [Variovorax paradoxus]|nr:phosphotransferase family protein [Variovorax paradoxus]MBT2301972.1 phosphotransferase family protein [Variovorax paradoxus]
MNPLLDEAALAPRIADYLAQQLGHPVRVGAVRRFPVGFSWLTFLVPVQGLDGGAGERDLILRLGPDFGLFAPYEAGPQVMAMQSLEGSGVPVPRAFWHSEDPSILGAPFMFCEKVSGSAVVPWVSPSEPQLPEDYRKRLGTQFIDALAALHRVEWQDKPIAAMAHDITAENAAWQNVEHWQGLIERWAMRPYPLAEWGIRWLKSHKPVAPRVAIVHGDYRTGNFLEQDGNITAILDWELVHLGDPHEDLAWVSMPMYMGGSPYLCRLCEPEWFYARYAEQAGVDVSMSTVRYYQVFSMLKLAATHMAAARCFEEGRFNDMRMPAMGSQVAACLRQMDKLIETA